LRARQFAISETELFEINMSPGNLKQLASKIDARVGMEFEMVVPMVENEEAEPDYDRDERVQSWSQVANFFRNNEYNSNRELDDLRLELNEEYVESGYFLEAEELWWKENEDYYVEQEIDEKIGEKLYLKATEIFDNEESDNEGYGSKENFLRAMGGQGSKKRDNAIETIYTRLLAEAVSKSIEDEDDMYQTARENAMEENEADHDRGFNNFLVEKYRWMSDIASNFSSIVVWPYYEQDTSNISTVANNFSPYVNMKVDYSQSYHGAKRRSNSYVVEPDGSISGNNSGDTGLEFVSPPLTLEEMSEHLEGVKEFAKDFSCYTNKSTGLHINVSVPNMTLDNLDYIKLALLLGDKYVLDQFDRAANTYCKSAMTDIIQRAKNKPDMIPGLLDMMKKGLSKIASKMIHSGTTGKYTSINTKEKYIEFRSPGGDWLNADLDKIVTTMNRFVVALDAAVDPEKYKEEYNKKLYKIIAPEDAGDIIKYFSRYAAGDLPKTALKSFLKQANLERQVNRNPKSDKSYWWNVSVAGSGTGAQVVAATKDEAINAAIASNSALSQYNRSAFIARIIYPYDASESDLPVTIGNTDNVNTNEFELVNNFGRSYGIFNSFLDAKIAAQLLADRYREPITIRNSQRSQIIMPQNELPRIQDGTITAPENDPNANFAIIRSSDNAVINYLTHSNVVQADNAFSRWLGSQGLGGTPHPGYYLIAIRPRQA
jgi:hypothetical protein